MPISKKIQEVVMKNNPASVMILKGDAGVFTFFHQRGILEEQLFCLPAACIISLEDREICLLVNELLTIGDAAATERTHRMDITERATAVRALADKTNDTKLYLFQTGVHRFE